MSKYLLDTNALIGISNDSQLQEIIKNNISEGALNIIHNVKNEFLRRNKEEREKFLKELKIVVISPSTTIFGLAPRFPLRFGGALCYGDLNKAFKNAKAGKNKALNSLIDALQVNTASVDNLTFVTNDKEPMKKTKQIEKLRIISFEQFKDKVMELK